MYMGIAYVYTELNKYMTRNTELYAKFRHTCILKIERKRKGLNLQNFQF